MQLRHCVVQYSHLLSLLLSNKKRNESCFIAQYRDEESSFSAAFTRDPISGRLYVGEREPPRRICGSGNRRSHSSKFAVQHR